MVRGALGVGYLHIDGTAVYGNEEQIGEVLEGALEASIRRDELWITSEPWNGMHGGEDVIPACQESVHDLRVGCLDAYPIHWPFPTYHSRSGALLPNAGPRPDGTIAEPEESILLEIGRWLALKGEAIWGTRPWQVFGEGPIEVMGGGLTDIKRQAFTERDVRCAVKGDVLYAIVLGWP